MRVFVWFLLVTLGAVAAPVTLFAGGLHIWAYIKFRERAGFRLFHVLTATGFAGTSGTITYILLTIPVRQVEPRPATWTYATFLALAAIGSIGLTRDAISIYVDKEASARPQDLQHQNLQEQIDGKQDKDETEGEGEA